MKKLFMLLIPIFLTFAVIILPDIYYRQQDKLANGVVQEDDLYVQVEDDVSVDKMIEIATNEDSRYIEQTDELQEKTILEVLDQLESILAIEISDKEGIIMNSIYKSYQIVGNSGFNSYAFSLCGMHFYDEEHQFFVMYIPDKESILFAEVFKMGGVEVLFTTVKYEIEARLEKYFGHDNWSSRAYEYELYFYQGTDGQSVWKIFDRMRLMDEVEAEEEIVYN